MDYVGYPGNFSYVGTSRCSIVSFLYQMQISAAGAAGVWRVHQGWCY